MAKGDDNVQRKKNKLTRKKMSRRNDSATVSTRIAAIIAAKKRRKSGKRSMCQGMCFSLPTLEDPFNERHGKADVTKNKTKKAKIRNKIRKEDEKPSSPSSIDVFKKPFSVSYEGTSDENMFRRPSEFMTSNLSEIEKSFWRDGIYKKHNECFMLNIWGLEFWQCFSSGKDILETSGTSSNWEQIAWLVSTAADAIARREKDNKDESFGQTPFLLYLVPSQSKASQVRSVSKALKGTGFHTVSLHQGASIDHQISGLKSVEPEFIVATPERLLEIVTLGFDISGVSFLVIDELGSLCSGGHLDAVKSIKQAISSKHQTIIFNDSFDASTIPAVQSLVGESIKKFTLSKSVASQSSCIIQSVNVCASEEEKLQKFAEVLDSSLSKIIYIVTKKERFKETKDLLKLKGISVSTSNDSKISEVKKSEKPLACLIDIEKLDSRAMRDFETVILPDFYPKIKMYTNILTSMAKESVHGVLHSFITEKEAEVYDAGELVNLLKECGQYVPDPWRVKYL